MLDQSSDQLSLSDSKSLSDSQPEGGVRGNSRRSVLPRPAVRRASAPRSDRAGQPSPAPGSAQNIWQSFSSLAAPAPDSGDAERKEARERSRSAPAPALDVQGILLNAKKGHRSSGLLLRPSPRSLARAARANRHSTPPEGAEHAHAKENGRQSRQDRRGSGAGAEAVAQLADTRHRRHSRPDLRCAGTDAEAAAAAAAREAGPLRRQHTRGSSSEGIWLQPTLTPLGVSRAKRRLLNSSPTLAVVGKRNGASGDGGGGGGASRPPPSCIPRRDDNEWRQRLACRAAAGTYASGTTIEDRAATYADRVVTVPPHAKSLAKLRRALAQRNASRARGEDPIAPGRRTSVKAVALFSPNKVHELHWSKYGSQYHTNAEKQRREKLAEANVCPPAAHRTHLRASAPPHPTTTQIKHIIHRGFNRG